MPALYNLRKGHVPGAVYIGRGSKWGNPYRAGVDGTRDEVIAKYKEYVYKSGLIQYIKELEGKDLICWCAPKRCHGDILLSLANDPLGEFYAPTTL